MPSQGARAENTNNGFDHKVDDDPEPDNAPDSSNSENSASHNARDTNNGNEAVSGFRNFCFTAMVKGAGIKIKAAALQARDSVIFAIKSLKEKGVIEAAKQLKDWVREHPWETALVAVPLLATACAAITLLAIGFGPGGIAAGSAAAAMQAGIGNVVAHSLFATCTSAMMGGYGAPIIFGGTWALAIVTLAVAKRFWRWWSSPNERRLVQMHTEPSMTVWKSLDKAADTLIFGSTCVVALLVYHVKSWTQARRQRPEEEEPLL